MRNTGGMQKQWCVYVIECESGAWYTGITNDLEQRFRKHAEGKGAKYFRMDKPKRIVAAKGCATKSEALSQEANLKQLQRADKQAWIAENPFADPQSIWSKGLSQTS